MNQVLTDTQATQKADKLRSISIEIKNLEQVKKDLENQLRLYVIETGNKDLGPILAYEKAKPAKLVGAEGKRLEQIQEALMGLFPDYTKRSLNITDMAKNIETDETLRIELENFGLGIEQEVELYFKSK